MTWALLALIVIAAYLGWRRGLLLMALTLLGFAAGYAASLVLYQPLGEVIGGSFGLQPLLAYPLGGLAAFILVQALFAVAAHLVKRRRRRKVRSARSARSVGRLLDRGGGALLGAAYGGGLALMIVWALLLLQTLAPGHAPNVRNTVAGRVAAPATSMLTRVITKQVTDSDTLGGAAAKLANDAGAIASLTQVISDKRVRAIFDDPRLLRRLARRDLKQAANDPKLRALARDQDLIRAAYRAGIVQTPPEQATPARLQQELASRMRPMAQAVINLANDPEVRALLEDPALKTKLERRQMLHLANDPSFNRLAKLVVGKLRAATRERAPKPARSLKK